MFDRDQKVADHSLAERPDQRQLMRAHFKGWPPAATAASVRKERTRRKGDEVAALGRPCGLEAAQSVYENLQ